MKVAELEGAELDYWVAKAQGLPVEMYNASIAREPKAGGQWYKFSREWEQGGPIIEREHIWLAGSVDGWRATMKPRFWGRGSCEGQTPLIAAMRCFVASKFGEETPGKT